MFDLFELVFQFLHIFKRHILDDDHRECTCAEFIHHNILTFYRFKRLWQITK